MKTAIYIEDGVVQLVVTPETEFEQNALSTFKDRPMDAKLYSGSFYDTRGGWVRQSAMQNRGPYSYSDREDRSLILTVRDSGDE